jgi:hypothetical protein
MLRNRFYNSFFQRHSGFGTPWSNSDFLLYYFISKFAQTSEYRYATALMGASFNFINLHGRHWTPLSNITIQIRRGSCTLAYFMGEFTMIFSYSGGVAMGIGMGWTLALIF